jgi:hypothetical protein
MSFHQELIHCIATRVRSAATCALMAAMAVGASAQTLPPEVQVGTADIIDHEFDWGRDGVYCPTCNYGAGNARLSYIDRDHNLWVGYVDYYTGNFYPPTGQAVLLDTNATAPIEIGNGPEWMVSQRGSEIVYTRWTDGMPRKTMYLNVGFARQGNGSWIAGSVDNSTLRVMPIGTSDLNDPYPTVHFQNAAVGGAVSNIFWRDVVPGSVEHKLPLNTNDPGMTRRWVPGSRDALITAPALFPATGAVYKQVFLFHMSTGVLEQLTFDPADKLWAFMWAAPEYDNENVFFVMVNGTQLNIYRNLGRPDGPRGGATRWRVVNTINMPAATPYISSPEPFVHNGRSYIFFSLSANPDLHAFSLSSIAISDIDPVSPTVRVLTSDVNPPRARRDPEYFITANGPYIYYNRYILPATGTPAQINEGVFRVDAGLGPPVATAASARQSLGIGVGGTLPD